MGLAQKLLNTQKLSGISHHRLQARSREAKPVLVLGGAGYLGSVLVRRLLRRGFAVRVLDALLFGSRSLAEFRGNGSFELIEGDLRDAATVEQSMRGCGAVVHLAAIVGDRACQEHQSLALEVNLGSTAMLADLSRRCGISRFIFASSCSVYGASDELLSESSVMSPLSIYAQTKEQSERLLLARFGEAFAPTILRLGTLFGLSPRMRFDLVVNLFVSQAASRQPITICNGQQWRPFLHVQDAARAFTACLEVAPQAVAGQVFNVGGRSLNCRIRDLAMIVADRIPGTRFCRVENGDRRDYQVSFEKIANAFGYRTEKDLA